MGRLVQPRRIAVVPDQGGGLEGTIERDAAAVVRVADQGDTYLERVAKYVPAELLAFYIFVNPILKQSLVNPGTMAGYSVAGIGVVVFVASWILTPVYLWRLGTPGDARLVNVAVATALFPIWAYAVEGVGPVQFLPFDGHLASVLLGAASVASGLMAPRVTSEVV